MKGILTDLNWWFAFALAAKDVWKRIWKSTVLLDRRFVLGITTINGIEEQLKKSVCAQLELEPFMTHDHRSKWNPHQRTRG